MYRKWYDGFLCCALSVLNLLDCASSLQLLVAGAVEANPIMSWVLSFGIEYLVIIKLLIALVAVPLAYFLLAYTRALRPFIVCVCVCYALVVGQNYYLIWKYGLQ
ncbi:MAG: DUF5658 family protein [Nitrososphaera sp.]|nr:DUF5658 family protein [Nitrososphaera sp.]